MRSQTISKGVEFQILVGIDAVNPPTHLAVQHGIHFGESRGRSQAAALNAAAKMVDGDLVAILEDHAGMGADIS